jgi:hypothetical protein
MCDFAGNSLPWVRNGQIKPYVVMAKVPVYPEIERNLGDLIARIHASDARLAVINGTLPAYRERGLSQFLLCPESDRIAARQWNNAMCQKQTHAMQQKNLINQLIGCR